VIRLGKFFGTGYDYWMKFQWLMDRWNAVKKNEAIIDSITAYVPISASAS